MYFNRKYLTTAGKNLLDQAVAGSNTVIWTKCATSSLSYANDLNSDISQVHALTDIEVANKYTSSGVVTSVESASSSTHDLKINCTVSNSDSALVSGPASTFGVWAKLGLDGIETLVVVAFWDLNEGSPETVPSPEQSAYSASVDMLVRTSDELISTITTNPSWVTPLDDFNNLKNRVVTSHSSSSSTTGESQTIYGEKTFKSLIAAPTASDTFKVGNHTTSGSTITPTNNISEINGRLDVYGAISMQKTASFSAYSSGGGHISTPYIDNLEIVKSPSVGNSFNPIEVYGGFIPSSSGSNAGSYSLGTASARWPNIYADSINASGTLTAGYSTLSSVSVSGNATVGGTLTATAATAGSLTVNGALDVNGTLSLVPAGSSLTVGGNITAGTVTATSFVGKPPYPTSTSGNIPIGSIALVTITDDGAGDLGEAGAGVALVRVRSAQGEVQHLPVHHSPPRDDRPHATVACATGRLRSAFGVWQGDG